MTSDLEEKPHAGGGQDEPEGQEAPRAGMSYRGLVWRQFRKNRLAVASLTAICLLALVAISADLLAGNKPYYMVYKGETYFPAFRQYAVYLGLTDWPDVLRRRRNFKRLKADRAIFLEARGPAMAGLELLEDPADATGLLVGDRSSVPVEQEALEFTADQPLLAGAAMAVEGLDEGLPR